MVALREVQVLENTKSIHTLDLIKEFQRNLQTLQGEASFWLTKDNELGNEKKEQAMGIFNHLEKLCESRSRTDSPTYR